MLRSQKANLYSKLWEVERNKLQEKFNLRKFNIKILILTNCIGNLTLQLSEVFSLSISIIEIH